MKGLTAVTLTAITLCLSSECSAGINSYIEDFMTTQYMDALYTTAWWDTVSGELGFVPFTPTLAGSCDTPGEARGIYVAGDNAFVADAGSGLQVADITDPSAPVLIGSYNTPGSAQDVYVSGNHAFVADAGTGLQVIDVTDPAAPVFAGSYNTPGTAWAVHVAGNHAFVADGDSGLQVIDITTPSAPTRAGWGATWGTAYGVYVSGDWAFVADGSYGFQVMDISDPSYPPLVANYDTPDIALDVHVSGDWAFVADHTSGLQVIDISAPLFPALAGSYNTPGLAYAVYVEGDWAYVADWGVGLHIIDISDPTNPTLAYTYDTAGDARGIHVSGVHAFVADRGSGLSVIKVSSPVTPTLAGAYGIPGGSAAVCVSGDHAFVVDPVGLNVVDISDPAVPTLDGAWAWPSPSSNGADICVSGDHAFASENGTGTSGISVFDVSNPAAPTRISTWTQPFLNWPEGLCISGDHVFHVDRDSLFVINVSEPSATTRVGACQALGGRNVRVCGDHAFVASYDLFNVFDITNLAAPTQVGSCDPPGSFAHHIDVSGSIALVTDRYGGLQVIDVSDPTVPVPVGSFDTPDDAWGVDVAGDYAFVAVTGSLLYVIDISDPTSPTLRDSCSTPGAIGGIHVSGGHAFVAGEGVAPQVIWVFQNEVADPYDNVGRSLILDDSDDTIVRTRLTATQSGPVTWDLSADSGNTWQDMESNGSWTRLTAPGGNLLWRSELTWEPGVSSEVSLLQIDWFIRAATIDSIVDMPEDQGGWVRLHHTRSGYDFSDEEWLPVSDYGIWRRVDDPGMISTLRAKSVWSVESSPTDQVRPAPRANPFHSAEASRTGKKGLNADAVMLAGSHLVAYQDRVYIQSEPMLGASSFPPGAWEWVATVPALQQDSYIAAVPTLSDSAASGPNHTVFVVTAHTTTPSIWYVSRPDSGYSVDNLAPSVPTGLAFDNVNLVWDECPDGDFDYFTVYGSATGDFGDAVLVGYTVTPAMDMTGHGYAWYHVTAIDFAGNESGDATIEDTQASVVPGAGIPDVYFLRAGEPNPFTRATSVELGLPSGGATKLLVFDVSGRLVATLVDEYLEPGQYQVTWAGADSEGLPVSSGFYFVKLDTGEFTATGKILLMR
jgi:hypothetical protein